jgi:serine/threonine-protein kinase
MRIDDDTVARLRAAAMWPELRGDRYQDVRLLARGGMGSVYAATDTLLDREVAIKVSNAAATETGTPRPALDQRLADESKILARLEHPGIVPIHDAGTLGDGRAFYVMKLVRGRTLDDIVASVPNATARLTIFERIVETVAFAHAAGVVHRDLKPSNVMIGAFGEVLVLDWGVARVIPSDNTPASADRGLRVGTPGFMAPEQQFGGAAVAGPSADVYALGAMLTWLRAGLPSTKRLQAIMDKCLSASPADRYRSAAELGDDLANERAGHPVTAYRDTWLDLAGGWFTRHRVFIALIATYLLMRVAFALYR